MKKICPETNEVVLYLTCQECKKHFECREKVKKEKENKIDLDKKSD